MFGNYTGLLDMINGAGAGAAGQTFQGSPISGLLNTMGVKPYGYADRVRQAQQMVQPVAPRPMAQPMPAAPAPAAPMGAPVQPVTTSSLDEIDQLIIDMIKAGILPNPANRVMESGPRQYSAGGNVAPMFYNNTPGYLR